MSDSNGRLASTGAVHVWHGRGPDEPDPADLAVLGSGELRCVRSRRAPLGAHYAAAHAALRRILADHYLGGRPDAIRFGRHVCPRCGDPAHGRPRISEPATGLEFSLSRAGARWAVAVTAGHRAGVDIEFRALSGFDTDGVSGLVLSGRELALVRAAGDADGRRDLLLRAWTRKEAVLKAVGTGIVADLRGLDVSPGDPGPVLVDHTEGGRTGRWSVGDLPLGPGLYAALATEAGRAGPVMLRPDRTAEREVPA